MTKHREQDENQGTNQAKFILAFAVSCAFVGIVFIQAPPLHEKVCDPEFGLAWLVKAVWNDKKKAVVDLKDCVKQYDEDHPNWMMVLYVLVYVTMQTFAIPGPIVLSLITGAVWPYFKSLFLISLCATSGASCCFLLSRFLNLGKILQRLNAERYSSFRERVGKEDKKGNLFFYMLFLRLTPLMPNWFVNLVSPAANVPLRTFALATGIGLIPANTLHYYSGKAISNAIEDSSSFWINLGIFGVLQVLALVPVFLKGKIAEMDKKRS